MVQELFIFQAINNLASQWAFVDALAVFFAKYFGYVLVGMVIILFWKKWQRIFWAFLSAILAGFGVVELIRFFWSRPRPFVENNVNLLIEAADKPSFPSGHAAFFFALSFVVYQYNKKAGLFFFLASCLIAISRVFVGIHWPTDIIGGAIIGIIVGWLITKFFKK